MCGIFSLINNNSNISFLTNEFNKGKHRGPEHSSISIVSINTIFGFHRLAINGLDDISNQPITIDNVVLICNGEIYNYKELYKLMNIVPTTNSDCEVIIHLYVKYGIEQTLIMLDGVFAFVLCDNRINTHTNEMNTIYIARDPYGIRPLYKLKTNETFGVASEIKMLNNLSNNIVEHFEPGTFMKFELDFMVNPKWVSTYRNVKYHLPVISTLIYNHDIMIYQGIQYYLMNAVKKRYLNTDRNVACLLSGGLDSSLITALVNEEHKKTNFSNDRRLETYSIGLSGSDDLLNARVVANYLNTNHTEILITEKDICDIIPEVIYNIESYDTTTIRASICNYLLGQYIKKHSESKVIFNGDGSDELCGGYLYMDYCPDSIEFDKETRRLLKDIHKYDVLRSDKCISSHGLEPRTPFLDKAFVDFYLSIPCELRFNYHKRIEKYLLREAFSNSQFFNSFKQKLLPDKILWRKKEAFSDGVSKQNRSLFVILQEFISSKYNSAPSIDLEKKYYKEVFDESYKNTNILSYLWLPKYKLSNDPSARTLQNYVKT